MFSDMKMLDALEMLAREMTVADLADRGQRSVGEIVEFALGGNRNVRSSRRPQRPRPIRDEGLAKVDTRTAAGRASYERALLAALADTSDPVGATKLRLSAGGTPSQARATLNRLIEAGRVSYVGKGRWTRYFLP